jgi:hypothetical protein
VCNPAIFYLLFIFYSIVIAPEPRTVMEALQQRYEELSKRHKEALTKGETAKARRMDRLTKVIEIFFKIHFYMFLFIAIPRSY